jgi:MoxR-like ATPase
MPEGMKFGPENSDFSAPAERLEVGDVLESVVFEGRPHRSGTTEYRSADPGRKIIFLDESSPKPRPGMPYRVKILQDTKPDDPTSGKLLVELIGLDTEALEEEDMVSYLGVQLPKAENRQNAPRPEEYADYINDPFALELQQKIAIAMLQGEPLLIEGGTSIGKTTTVKKMCADLGYEVHYANLNGATDIEDLMGRYIPNSNKRTEADPEYVFADGRVTSGLRQEEGRIKVIILDELNSAAPNILIRLHEVLDALERGGAVVLSEDASEMVPVDKQRTKIIALMNPPGRGYLQREPLDPAQLRRWVYQKEVSDLPPETFAHATDVLFGIAPNVADAPDSSFSLSNEEMLSREQLADIPGISEVTAKFREFHTAAKQLLTTRRIGQDQPQPFLYDDRMEPRRVRDFVRRFYRGDLNGTFQSALRYYYVGKVLDKADKAKLEELVKHVEYIPPAGTSKRKGVS